jgi:hypothetical protein
MDSAARVDRQARRRLKVVSTKYPLEKVKLLEAIQARRGDDYISRTVAYALDQLIEEHFPGAIEEAA